MKEQEAIELLDSFYEMDEMHDAAQIAIKALEEIQQYRAIGTVEELKESKEQYDIINCAAKSIQLSGLCDFENAKGKIISEIKRNYEYSLKDYEVIGTPEQCRVAVKFKEYFDELYGNGLEVVNWHQNGDTEPFDNFYESALDRGDEK